MNVISLLSAGQIEVPCTVDVEHTSDSLHAHVELAFDLELRPGDDCGDGPAASRVFATEWSTSGT